MLIIDDPSQDCTFLAILDSKHAIHIIKEQMTVGIELIVRLVENRANMRDILIGIGLIPIDRVFVEISGQSFTVDHVLVVMANGLCLSGLFVGDFLFDDSLIDIALLVLAELFANTTSGAKASAVLYSIVETAKINGLEPYHYLTQLFEQLPTANTPEALAKLLPY